jgi:hypothetical protein
MTQAEDLNLEASYHKFGIFFITDYTLLNEIWTKV